VLGKTLWDGWLPAKAYKYRRKRVGMADILMIPCAIYMTEGATDSPYKSSNNKSIKTLLFAAQAAFVPGG